ncbi:YicC family protein [Parvimonas micra]|uniref:YicC/YloC family endoribonuclease n=1 Tax=Parvimonas micra TaxID=33033 RepID=UPI001E337174|nr:YicC/YloC family endoribonuclease [Parvimonas micra]MCE3019373.1 YicC family protein [Parvimonas micra]
MLKSMTGYGRSEFVDENYDLSFEMKAVNHKFLDIQVKLPYFLNFCEEDIKKVVRKKLSRGRVDIFIRGKQKFSENNSALDVNYELASAYFEAYKSISTKLGIDASVGIGHIVRNDYVVEVKTSEIDEEYLKNNVLESVEKAVDELVSMRLVEGENLNKDLLDNLSAFENNLENIIERKEDVLNNQIDRLKLKLNEFCGELSESEVNRLNLEVIFYTDKLDISEEITRLNSHIQNFKKFLNLESQVGKKIEFLLQEMNREINTIASKSNNYAISTYVIEMKVIIEKLREQIQNVE